MFVGCSEISVNVIVKHKQHVGIIWPFCLPWGYFSIFSVLGGTEKKYWFAVCKGGSALRLVLCHVNF